MENGKKTDDNARRQNDGHKGYADQKTGSKDPLRGMTPRFGPCAHMEITDRLEARLF